jgi:uncharacterized membrane protein YuzA (DUF378 family)
MQIMDQKTLVLIIQVILIVGAVNWGLVAYNGTDLVKTLVGSGNAEKYVKMAVGLAGLYAAFLLVQSMNKKS